MYKKYFLSFAVISSFLGYSYHEKTESLEANTSLVLPENSPTATPALTNPDTGIIRATSTPTVSKPKGAYRDGSYTGQVSDALYGWVQVKAIITNGRLSDVQTLQYPSDRRTSIEINSQAIPYLKQEAIAAQSANINIVSGATQTSRAYKESLASALLSAK